MHSVPAQHLTNHKTEHKKYDVEQKQALKSTERAYVHLLDSLDVWTEF